jgi:hypothetical protein
MKHPHTPTPAPTSEPVHVPDSVLDRLAKISSGSLTTQLYVPAWCAGVTATTRLSYHHVADLQTPIACAGVAVYPGDVIHGDADNISVIPAHLAADMADLCEAQDDIEAYLAKRVAAGEALWGLYPPSDETRARHKAWVAAGRPAI